MDFETVKPVMKTSVKKITKYKTVDYSIAHYPIKHLALLTYTELRYLLDKTLFFSIIFNITKYVTLKFYNQSF